MTKRPPQDKPSIAITAPLRWLEVWDALLSVSSGGQASFRVDAVADQAGMPLDVVQSYIARLMRGGIVEKLTTRGTKLRLTSVPALPPSELWPEQQQLWNAMRTMKTFTFEELVFAASTDNVAIPHQLAREYVDRLEAEGYLQTNKFRVDTGHVYRLVPSKNTGALAPVLVEIRLPRAVLFDRNTKTAGRVEPMEILQ